MANENNYDVYKPEWIPEGAKDEQYPGFVMTGVYRMHVDPDLVRQRTDRGERISLADRLRGDPQDDLVAQLEIKCFITVKIDL